MPQMSSQARVSLHSPCSLLPWILYNSTVNSTVSKVNSLVFVCPSIFKPPIFQANPGEGLAGHLKEMETSLLAQPH